MTDTVITPSVEGYSSWLKGKGSLESRSFCAYVSDARHFMGFFSSVSSEPITADSVAAYLAREELHPLTRRRRLSTLVNQDNGLLAYLKESGVGIEVDPKTINRTFKIEYIPPAPRVATQEEYDRLVRQIRLSASSANPYPAARDVLIVTLLNYTGVSLDSLIGKDCKDLRIATSRDVTELALVRGKKEVVVNLSYQNNQDMANYFTTRMSFLNGFFDPGKLILNNSRKPIKDNRHVRRVFIRHAKAAGMDLSPKNFSYSGKLKVGKKIKD